MGKSPLSILVILLLLVAFNNCDENKVKEGGTEVAEEEDADIFNILTKQTDEERNLTSGVQSDAVRRPYQGDIMLDETPDQVFHDMGRKSEEGSFGVLIWPLRVWRTREIPYAVTMHSQYEIRKIKAAMRDLEKVVCIKFRPKVASDKHWLNIEKQTGCWSVIGKSHSSKTKLSLPSYCIKSHALIIHELVHALGFAHEQARRDRDFYVKVLSKNIISSLLYNFDKVDGYSADTFGTPYDYQSIMHYGRASFSKNGQNTLEAKSDPNRKLGGRRLSKYDIQKLTSMYQCNLKASQGWSEWSDWSPCLKIYKGCYQSQYRICFAKNLASCPGSTESGVRYKTRQCESEKECKKERFDGNWGSWSSWSTCSKSCDIGTRSRSRRCDSPSPSNGGKECVGSSTDVEKCILKTCQKNKFFTNFDDGFGMWYNVNKGQYSLKWRRGRGQLSSVRSGPQGDHTDGKGWYLYVSSKIVDDNRKRALLTSEYMSGFKCLSFAYCMNGKYMGQLTFYIIQSNGKLIDYSFKKKGHQGKDWYRIEVSLDNPDFKKFSYRIFIEAMTGMSPYTDIAIDDLLIENGPCGANSIAKKPITSALVASSGCKDTNSKCNFWANTGECITNPGFMKKHCCLSCKDVPECKKDIHSILSCNDWVGNGECMKNSNWMWKNCCLSCLTVQGSCDSKHVQCDQWANEGYCKMRGTAFWMNTNCCYPCYNAWKNRGQCIDRHDRCKEWAAKGECKKNHDWMMHNCCKSCKQV